MKNKNKNEKKNENQLCCKDDKTDIMVRVTSRCSDLLLHNILNKLEMEGIALTEDTHIMNCGNRVDIEILFGLNCSMDNWLN